MKEHAGFWTEKNNQLCEKRSDRHHVAAHVGIDRHTNTAAESIFYTLEALLPSDQKEDLHGWLTADTDALQALNELLRQKIIVSRLVITAHEAMGRCV